MTRLAPFADAELRGRHQALFDLIPKFDCIPGCRDCCGPVPFSEWEWANLGVRALAEPPMQSLFEQMESGTAIGDLCLACPYSQSGGCAIYPDRPFMCRLFGAVDTPRLTCPHGCGPDKKLSAKEAAALTAIYRQMMDDKP